MRTFLVCARALARAQHPIATCGAERRTEWSSGVGSSLLHRLPPHELQVFLACAVGEDLSPLCIQPLRARARLPVRLPCATMQCVHTLPCAMFSCSLLRRESAVKQGMPWVDMGDTIAVARGREFQRHAQACFRRPRAAGLRRVFVLLFPSPPCPSSSASCKTRVLKCQLKAMRLVGPCMCPHFMKKQDVDTGTEEGVGKGE
jgi:hypothetical protein